MIPRSVRPSRPPGPIRPWIKQPEAPAPATLTSAQQKALRCPRPGPGIVVSVPLDCLMEYLAIYKLAPDGIREPKFPQRDGPGEAILLVKHVKGDTDEQGN